MDIQATKIDLIHWLTELQDPAILKQLTVIRDGQDWWDEISIEERLAVDEGIGELDRGDGVPHSEVLKKIQAKFSS